MRKIKTGDKYLVVVHGWIMCDKIESGNYRIEISYYHDKLTATFFRPKGNKPIVRHYLSQIMLDYNNEALNSNRTEILKQVI